MQRKRVSIKDLASLADVSAPTVSRALRGEGRMSDDTRERIVQLAREHGYMPSLVARGLVMRRSYCIGLVVPQFADPFHSTVAQGVEDEAHRHGYSLFLASSGVDPQRELEVVRTFHGRQVDGIISSSSRVGEQYQQILGDADVPILLLNSHVDAGSMHSIYHDDYHGGCLLVRHLLDRGYRRIAFIGNERGIRATQQRRSAWIDTLEEAGLPTEVEAFGPNGRQQGGILAAEALLEKATQRWNAPPEAIYCYNDTMAIGALSVLRQKHLHVPQDVAVTGFDDIDIAAFTEPPLTTLHQPRYEMGVEAMRMLLSLIEHKVGWDTPQISVVTGKLVVREST
ncbi:MAG: LacI family DNA-binding transcriptional regulator [Caldilineaceae bacterium]